MMKLILASNNQKKMSELRAILSDLPVEIISQREAGCSFEAEETGTTFEENAFIKADAAAKATGLPAIADDSGLMVDALGGEPGVYSARYTGSHDASDRERYEFLLKKLGDEKNRSARFVSCICCLMPDGTRIEARGECPGEILFTPKGDGGFGYDPVFRPEGFNESMAELGPEVKNRISHRARSLEIFKAQLKEYMNGTYK
jgi:XTP/dITP diphosphohydrolase